MPPVGDLTRVVLADDEILLLEGLASLLERAGFDVVGRAGEPDELLEVVREQQPDIVIVDIRMPPSHTTEGLDAARAIRAEFPEVGILVLSAHLEVMHTIELLAGGQRTGYLLKRRISAVDDFVDAVRRVAAGGSVVDPSIFQELVSARRVEDPLAALTTREREVLALMAEGRSNAGIAASLWLAEGTVEKHVSSIMSKLDLSENTEDHRRVLAVITFLDAH